MPVLGIFHEATNPVSTTPGDFVALAFVTIWQRIVFSIDLATMRYKRDQYGTQAGALPILHLPLDSALASLTQAQR